MKKYFLIGLCLPIALIAILGFTSRKDYLPNNLSSTIICKTLSAAQNNYELLENVTGRTYVIDSVMFSALTAQYLYMNDSATAGECEYGYVYVPATGTFLDRDVCLKLEKSAGLYVNCGGASYIQIDYHLE